MFDKLKEHPWLGMAALGAISAIFYAVYEVGRLGGRVDELNVDDLRQYETRIRDMLVGAEGQLKDKQRRWCDVTSERQEDVWYRTDAEEIELSIRVAASTYGRCQVAVDINTIPPAILGQNWVNSGTNGQRCTLTGLTIPANTNYRVDLMGTLATWWELREKCSD